MWELIRANKRNSIILMTLMAVVLLMLGYIIGAAAVGPQGGPWGIVIAAVVWLILTAISFAGGDEIFLMASHAKPVTKDVNPQLFNVVEEMTIAAGLGKMPKVYIIADHAPNAFATGRNPEDASIAVTAGLLGRLNRDELQGVIGHEMSHIINRDILFVTLAGIMLGTIVLLSELLIRGVFYGGLGGRRRYSGGGQSGGAVMLIIVIAAIVAAILAPIMAQLLYFALSRRREYLADAGSARLTRYPEGLASALEKISSDPAPQLASANKVTAPMYIVNPFKRKGSMKLSDLTSTHPPTSERIRILRNMMHGASFKDYSEAYTSTTHHKTIVPVSAMTKEDVTIREASERAAKEKRKADQMRQVGDIMRVINGFVFLTCVCGLKLKIPPNYKGNSVKCPRCGKILPIPRTPST
jgi:heat shock protein HtpX